MTDSASLESPATDGISNSNDTSATETEITPSQGLNGTSTSTSTVLTQLKHTYSSATPSAPRIALITGAAQGIGRGIALRFAQDGYKVAITDLPSQIQKLQELEREINLLTSGEGIDGRENGCESPVEVKQGKGGVDGVDKEDRERRGRVVVLFADVSKEEDVRTMVDECVSALGGLDVMVANAGIAIYKPLLELPVEEFDSVIAVNLRGAMLCYKYAAQQMVKQGRGGRIIGASSMYGKAGAPNLAGYSASKFGIRGLTHTAAREWGKYGITVNAYAPAGIRTPMLEDYDDRYTSESGMKKGELLEQLGDRAPVGHLGGPTDVASLVAYLASPEAHFITGQTISVDGGAFVD